MRKGEKLYNFLNNKMNERPEQEHHKTMSPSAIAAEEYAYSFAYLEQMTDEEFNKIVYDVENNENWVEGYEIGKGT